MTYYFLLINIVTFVLYGIDKRKAQKGKWRIPEKTLLLMATAGGAFGALCAMHIYRHKTKNLKFKLGVPVLLAIQIVILYVCYYSM